jgi:hypothetical protein
VTASGWSHLPPHDPRPLGDDPEPAAIATTVHPAAPLRVRPEQLALLKAGLSDHSRVVLRSLAALPYLTTRQIERLHFREDTQVTPLAATRRAHRCLARLHDVGLVDRLDRRIGGARAGSAAYIWRLSPAGARTVDLRRQRRSPIPGLLHIAHWLDVAEVVVRLHEQTRHHPTHVEVVNIETEPTCWRRLATGSGRPGWLKPDLRVTLRVPGHELHWFVEVDRGHEHRGALTRKMSAYVAAWRDGNEQARTGVFPRVLWIVPNNERAAEVEAHSTSTPGALPGLFVVATRAAAIDTLQALPQ